jgi:hypothetical protein
MNITFEPSSLDIDLFHGISGHGKHKGRVTTQPTAHLSMNPANAK